MKKIVGYANAWSVAPGETLSVMVSTYGPDRYRADLVRVICGDDDPDHGIYREEEIAAPFSGEYPGRMQPIAAGSYATVPDAPAIAALQSFTVQAWIFPTTPDKGVQGLIANWRDETASGFALLIDEAGALAMRLGDGSGGVVEISTGKPLAARRWHLIAGRIFGFSVAELKKGVPIFSTESSQMTRAIPKLQVYLLLRCPR